MGFAAKGSGVDNCYAGRNFLTELHGTVDREGMCTGGKTIRRGIGQLQGLLKILNPVEAGDGTEQLDGGNFISGIGTFNYGRCQIKPSGMRIIVETVTAG